MQVDFIVKVLIHIPHGSVWLSFTKPSKSSDFGSVLGLKKIIAMLDWTLGLAGISYLALSIIFFFLCQLSQFPSGMLCIWVSVFIEKWDFYLCRVGKRKNIKEGSCQKERWIQCQNDGTIKMREPEALMRRKLKAQRTKGAENDGGEGRPNVSANLFSHRNPRSMWQYCMHASKELCFTYHFIYHRIIHCVILKRIAKLKCSYSSFILVHVL